MALINVELTTPRLTQRLAQFLAVTTQETAHVVAEVAAQVKADTQIGWPIDSGASRAGWTDPRQVGPLAYQISNPFRYSLPIEYGLYAHPGAKTEYFPGTRLLGGLVIEPGVFPRQRPAAPLRRALAKSYGEMAQRIRDAHQQRWGK